MTTNKDGKDAQGSFEVSTQDQLRRDLSAQERRELYEMLSQRVTLPALSWVWDDIETRDFLRRVEAELIGRLRNLLEKHSEQAFQALYRVDVSEKQVNQVMASCGPSMWPEAFARLVMERQLEKLETRRRWQEHFAPSGDG